MEVRPEIYQFFAEYISKATGIGYSASNFYQLDARFDHMMEKFSIASIDDLYMTFRQGPTADMHSELVDVSTNNETFFFREMPLFTFLQTQIFPEWANNHKQSNYNIWSLACSTGQELYSILMTWDKVVKPEAKLIHIKGSDISQRALAKARSGKYNQLEVQRGLSIFDLQKYFKSQDHGEWKINDELRLKPSFEQMNMLDPKSYPVEEFDMILCRNVLIYHSVENRNLVISNIMKALKPGGIFVLSTTESLMGIKNSFESMNKPGLAVYKKPLLAVKAA